MKINTLLIIVLMSISTSVFSHPGHDHSSIASSAFHGWLFIAACSLVAMGLFFIKSSQKKSSNMIEKNGKK